jgi:signal transduction histidine kinase
MIAQTRRPARVDDWTDVPGPISAFIRAVGINPRSAARSSSWGAYGAPWHPHTTTRAAAADTESRLENFTELVATAISNIQARSDLAASRARIVAATDEERRRVVRDLHDGAQQRLVHTILTLKLARRALDNAEDTAPALLTEALDHAEQATAELRELAHGILPAALIRGGGAPEWTCWRRGCRCRSSTASP